MDSDGVTERALPDESDATRAVTPRDAALVRTVSRLSEMAAVSTRHEPPGALWRVPCEPAKILI
jgi:hypothetical protein